MCWSIGQDLASYEREAIQKAFRFYEGNKTLTAKVLGISIRTLDARLEDYRKFDEKAEREANERYERSKAEYTNRNSPNPGTPRVLRGNRKGNPSDSAANNLSASDSDATAEEQVG